MDTLIRLDGVSKVYPRVHEPWERMRAFGALLMGREPSDGAEVLSNVSLEVLRGQSLGIIGENGAGKSTLLKVLTGVIQPSRGTVSVNARIAAMLELGAGFQPDFSGLDNVRMKASLLGMSRERLDACLDDILEFADIGDYIHEPVKHYSSGMVVRLGFAVVTASEPELLITDEVLAVGDESFQKKCIRWIENFLGNDGTLLMVSHSMWLVQKLCQRALWIHEGKTREFGEAYPVTQSYLSWHEERAAAEKRARAEVEGDGGFYRLSSFIVTGDNGEEPAEVSMEGALTAELVVYSPDGRSPKAYIGIVRADGTPVYGVGSDAEPTRMDENRFRFVIRFDSLPLLPGSYNFLAHAMDPEGLRVCDTREQMFRVTGGSPEVGFVRLPHEWSG